MANIPISFEQAWERRVAVSMDYLRSAKRIPREWLEAAEVHVAHDFRTDEILLALVLNIVKAPISQTVGDAVEEEQIDKAEVESVPATVWDALKEDALRWRWLGPLVQRLCQPVAYRDIVKTTVIRRSVKRVTNHFHCAPFPAGTPKAEYLTFLQRGNPYEGSMEQYQAMKRIADIVSANASLALPTMSFESQQMMDLLHAIDDYHQQPKSDRRTL